MGFVVDSSVFVKWLVPEAHTEKATALVERLSRREIEAISPDLVSAEVGHALRSYFLAGDLSREECFSATEDFAALAPAVTSSMALMQDAARLALDNMGSFYDGLFVALALRERCPLLTADERMMRAYQRVAPFVWIGDISS